MASKKEYIQLIDKLTELTQDEELLWDRRPCPEKLISDNKKIDVIYEARFKEKNLRLYEEKYKNYTDEDIYYWADSVVLEFIDNGGGHIWEFPLVRSTWSLLKAVKYNEAEVDAFIDAVLNDE